MSRHAWAAALGVALATVLATPGAALAREPAPPIVASGELVFLSGDHWHPEDELRVTVVNEGAESAEGYFLLYLPTTVEVRDPALCERIGGETEITWRCGGAELPADGRREYLVPLRSIAPEPVFGVQVLGYVAGATADGQAGQRRDFLINWPDRLPLRLSATVRADSARASTVDVRVTNAGTFAISSYSLFIENPDGVRVRSPHCARNFRTNGWGCELYRGGRLDAGATDAFPLRFTVRGGPTDVQIYLVPTNRYTNDDVAATVTLGGAGSPAAPTPSPTATATPVPTPSATSGAGAGGGAGLPVTGLDTLTVLTTGGALLAGGAGLLLVARRRRPGPG